jgi:hypothetical protein
MLFHKEVLWCGWCTTEKKRGKFRFLVQMDAVDNEERATCIVCGGSFAKVP